MTLLITVFLHLSGCGDETTVTHITHHEPAPVPLSAADEDQPELSEDPVASRDVAPAVKVQEKSPRFSGNSLPPTKVLGSLAPQQTIEVLVELPHLLAIELRINDQVVAAYPAKKRDHAYMRETTLRFTSPVVIDSIKAFGLFPEGWQALQVDPYYFREENATEPKCHLHIVEPDTRIRLELLVDNRGNNAVAVAVGAMVLQAPSDYAGPLPFFAPTTIDSGIIRIGDTEIGRFESGAYLIDVSGNRSYRWREVAYGVAGSGGPVLGSQADSGEFCCKFLHQIPRVDFFLENAPGTIKTLLGLGTTKIELTEAPRDESIENLRRARSAIPDVVAERKLRLAKMLAANGVIVKAKMRYQEIVDKYPGTTAAHEAASLLEALNGREPSQLENE